jgi:hypothetical protein
VGIVVPSIHLLTREDKPTFPDVVKELAGDSNVWLEFSISENMSIEEAVAQLQLKSSEVTPRGAILPAEVQKKIAERTGFTKETEVLVRDMPVYLFWLTLSSACEGTSVAKPEFEWGVDASVLALRNGLALRKRGLETEAETLENLRGVSDLDWKNELATLAGKKLPSCEQAELHRKLTLASVRCGNFEPSKDPLWANVGAPSKNYPATNKIVFDDREKRLAKGILEKLGGPPQVFVIGASHLRTGAPIRQMLSREGYSLSVVKDASCD